MYKPLPPKMYELALMVAEGLTNVEIAARTGNTEGTIKVKIHKLTVKLGQSRCYIRKEWYPIWLAGDPKEAEKVILTMLRRQPDLLARVAARACYESEHRSA